MYECMGVYMDDRSTKTIIFDQGVRKYIRATVIMISDHVYVTGYNCNWPLFRVEIMQVTILDLANTSTF